MSMSFKQRLVVFGIIFATVLIAVPFALPWMSHSDAIGSFSFIIEYPFILILLGGLIVAGLANDRLS
ncbi:hypothetical protein EXE53_18210 [Halorubrum sp. SD626R]|uniref:hypothetical protein n=1 Tax=Halorubrum sp. SD626R TaxID=1419722 RepID=UPI0010F935CC|nr:hypothetical protein [Halorubrum sp. SD626R]TKX78997.1 hypothetical protein EXE53_18210 [Halorubrum sp. SD626R]